MLEEFTTKSRSHKALQVLVSLCLSGKNQLLINSLPVVVAQTCQPLLCAPAAQTRTLHASRLASSKNSVLAVATLSAIRGPAGSTDSLPRFFHNASTKSDRSAESSNPRRVSMRP